MSIISRKRNNGIRLLKTGIKKIKFGIWLNSSKIEKIGRNFGKKGKENGILNITIKCWNITEIEIGKFERNLYLNLEQNVLFVAKIIKDFFTLTELRGESIVGNQIGLEKT